jgi:hypothetical protein
MGRWIDPFDPQVCDLDELLNWLSDFKHFNHLRRTTNGRLANPNVEVDTQRLGNFLELIDGVTEDIGRLEGYCIEYEYASKLRWSIEEYRKELVVPEPEHLKTEVVVFSTPAFAPGP